MAVAAAQVTVAASATAVLTAGVAGVRAVVANAGSTAVFLGPSTVTTSNGFSLANGTSVEVKLNPGDVLYGIVAAGTEPVHVLSA